MSYAILFNNGTTINIDATDAIFHEAVDYETFVKDDSVVARINLNNVAGWINIPDEQPKNMPKTSESGSEVVESNSVFFEEEEDE